MKKCGICGKEVEVQGKCPDCGDFVAEFGAEFVFGTTKKDKAICGIVLTTKYLITCKKSAGSMVGQTVAAASGGVLGLLVANGINKATKTKFGFYALSNIKTIIYPYHNKVYKKDLSFKFINNDGTDFIISFNANGLLSKGVAKKFMKTISNYGIPIEDGKDQDFGDAFCENPFVDKETFSTYSSTAEKDFSNEVTKSQTASESVAPASEPVNNDPQIDSEPQDFSGLAMPVSHSGDYPPETTPTAPQPEDHLPDKGTEPQGAPVFPLPVTQPENYAPDNNIQLQGTPEFTPSFSKPEDHADENDSQSQNEPEADESFSQPEDYIAENNSEPQSEAETISTDSEPQSIAPQSEIAPQNPDGFAPPVPQEQNFGQQNDAPSQNPNEFAPQAPQPQNFGQPNNIPPQNPSGFTPQPQNFGQPNNIPPQNPYGYAPQPQYYPPQNYVAPPNPYGYAQPPQYYPGPNAMPNPYMPVGPTRICPRCGLIVPANQRICARCGLFF